MKDLLLLLCHYPYDEKNRVPLSKLIEEISDWSSLVNLINAHGIIALAAYNIKEAKLENSIPKDAMSFLENGHRKSMLRNLWLTERWKEVNTILENAGIKHILLKGMALEHTLYGSRGLRQMADNDILINKDDSIKAWELLQKTGFTHELIKSPLHKKIILDIGKHLPTLIKDGYSVEIHTRLFDFNDELNQMAFKDPYEIYIENTKVLVLDKNMQYEYLIHHFKKHLIEGIGQLRLYVDLKLLKNESPIEFPEAFILNPRQEHKPEYRKSAYKTTIKSIPPHFRFRFILGDTFPTLTWMKKRYKCGVVSALVRYPARILKIMWLF